MSDIDAVEGMYNIIVNDEWESADHQVPVEEFLTKLKDRDIPDEICVVGLEEVLQKQDGIQDDLISTMRQEMDYLNGRRPLPAIQFAVDGDVQGTGESFEVEVDGEFCSLQPIFGRGIKQRDSGWLVTSFRV
jgi:hypothetical protein